MAGEDAGAVIEHQSDRFRALAAQRENFSRQAIRRPVQLRIGERPLGRFYCQAISRGADLLLEALRDRLLDLVVGERNMRMDRVEWKASKGTIRVHDARLLFSFKGLSPAAEL